MDASNEGLTTAGGEVRARAGGGWLASGGLGVVLLGAYLANGREIGSYDTEPTTLLTVALVRGDGPFLDRFGAVLWESDGTRPPYVGRSGRRIVSLYPVAPALMAVPLVAPQIWLLDKVRPGWDADPGRAWQTARGMAKRAAAGIAALAGVVLHRLLRRMVPGWAAIAAVLVAGLGSEMWTVGSQALWQHAPAALWLSLAWLVLTPPGSEGGGLAGWRFAAGGVAVALLVACRAIDAVFAAIVAGWVATYHRRGLGAFLPGPLLIGGALLAYNAGLFGTLSGGQAKLESVHPEIHGVPGAWSGDWAQGLAGTLISPARGLFVYCPWVALGLFWLRWTWGMLPRRSLSRWMVAGLLPYLLLLSRYAVWWAGHTFGPRYWADATPVFAVLLALALLWCWRRWRPGLGLFGAAAAWSVMLQGVGAYCYPSSWNLRPRNVDRAHERLWDWRDTEVRRAIVEALESRDRE